MFFTKIANNKDYVYNFCNRQLNGFDKHCHECFFYNLVKNFTITDDDYNMLTKFNNQDMGIYMI